jgi:hypothetical protein
VQRRHTIRMKIQSEANILIRHAVRLTNDRRLT